jgi:hypothetical protein
MSVSNGGNPRLDRIEKLLEESTKRYDRFIAGHERAIAKHERFLVDHERFLVEHERSIRRIDKRLNHFVQLGVREARSQRERSRVLDGKITQLAAAQVVTEEKLQRFISSLGTGGNGKSAHKR